jgi:hypothetical protein
MTLKTSQRNLTKIDRKCLYYVVDMMCFEVNSGNYLIDNRDKS